jgi:hypothetical protein
MANNILLKKSSVQDKVPVADDLQYGELALNFADGNLFFKTSGNAVGTLASTKFVSVTGNVTGGNIVTAGQVSATGNISGNFFTGNGSLLTGLNSNAIVNGTSNVTINTANANVQIAVASVANSVVIGAGSLFVQGPISTPKTISTLALVPASVNALMLSPVTIEAGGNIFVPTDSNLTVVTPAYGGQTFE